MARSLATLVAGSLLAYQTNGQTDASATATFNVENTEISGYVKVTNGYLMMNLDFSGNTDSYTDDCLSGLKFHIHERYDYANTTDRVGSQCARSKTGNHWDPWVACGSATDNDYCAVDSETSYGCVHGSSVFGFNGSYSCSPTTFAENPYACEVGDWNGKYGTVTPDSSDMVDVTFYSPYEVSAEDLQGLSVVFHCGDSGDRAFCAGFEYDIGDGEADRPEQTDNYDMEATFDAVSSNSYVKLMTNGDYDISIDTSSFTLPDDCGDYLYLRVYEDWTYDGTSTDSMCSNYVGGFYDPTVTCAYGSSNEYCTGQLLCDYVNYTYTCDTNTFLTPYDRFTCAPGDLTGKYGGLMAESAATASGNDPIQIDLSQLSGRSAVLQCSDTWEIVACAGFSAIGDSDLDAMASFSSDNTGVEGYVYVGDGTIEISLDISGLNETNFTGIPGGESCFEGGLGYHIHELYDYDDNYDRLGDACARTYTGNHWDPYVACGSATDNDYCASDTQSALPDGGCVLGSSVLGDSGYDCSTFSTNPYVCEVGDLSGKYGSLVFEDNVVLKTAESPFEVTGADLTMGGYSIVFHCNDGSRAFCAPFVEVDKPDTTVRPTQSGTNDDMIAFIGDNNYVLLEADGSYTVSLEAGDYSDCSGNIMYRIYESCDSSAGFYDPTVTCAGGSANSACTGTYLCNDTDYSYSCNTDYPYTCAPGDLSGKYGTVPSSEPGATVITGTDDLMIDLGLISGLGLVVQCDDYSIQACAEFEMYTGTLPTEEPEADMDTTSDEMTGMDTTGMKDSPEDDDDKAFAMSVQFGTIMVMMFSVGLMFL